MTTINAELAITGQNPLGFKKIVIITTTNSEMFLEKMDNSELRQMIIYLSGDNSRLEKENKNFKEEIRTITEAANKSAVAYAELRQAVYDSLNEIMTNY